MLVNTPNGEMELRILHLTAVVRKENPLYSSWCPELDIASQGKTIDQALQNLKDAVDLCLQHDEVRAKIIEEVGELVKEGPGIFCFDVNASE